MSNETEKTDVLSDASGAPISEETVDEILRKVDAESRTRKLTPLQEKIVAVIAVAFTLFQLYTAIFGALAPAPTISVPFTTMPAVAAHVLPSAIVTVAPERT